VCVWSIERPERVRESWARESRARES